MSPGSRGRGFGGRKVGSAFSLQPPGPRRPCRRCALAWRGGSGRGTEPAGWPGVGGRKLRRATFVCLLSTTGVHLNPPSLAVPDETRFFLRRKVTDRHGGQPTTQPRFCRTWLASPPPVPESGEPSPAFSPRPLWLSKASGGPCSDSHSRHQTVLESFCLLHSLGSPFLEYKTVPCLSLSPPPLVKLAATWSIVGTRYLLAEDPSLPLKGQDIYLWRSKAVAQHRDDRTASVS